MSAASSPSLVKRHPQVVKLVAADTFLFAGLTALSGSPRENAPVSDVVQSENSVQSERKTLRAEDVSLDDASSDGKRLRTQDLAAR